MLLWRPCCVCSAYSHGRLADCSFNTAAPAICPSPCFLQNVWNSFSAHACGLAWMWVCLLLEIATLLLARTLHIPARATCHHHVYVSKIWNFRARWNVERLLLVFASPKLTVDISSRYFLSKFICRLRCPYQFLTEHSTREVHLFPSIKMNGPTLSGTLTWVGWKNLLSHRCCKKINIPRVAFYIQWCLREVMSIAGAWRNV